MVNLEIIKEVSRERARWLASIAELRRGVGLKKGVLISLGLALLTGMSAQLRLPIPFSPVPITGQVFIVLLLGFIFGKEIGLGSQLFYVGLGGAGVPWFTGLSGGFTSLTGPTGGYILGFLPAIYLVGWLSESFELKGISRQFLAGLAGLGVIYLFGSLQLSLFLNSGFSRTVSLGVLPFAWLDIGKVLLVSLVVKEFNPANP